LRIVAAKQLQQNKRPETGIREFIGTPTAAVRSLRDRWDVRGGF
jgi:hypothetical protein